MTITPRTGIVVTEGSPAQLSCIQPNGSEPYSVSWTLDGQPLPTLAPPFTFEQHYVSSIPPRHVLRITNTSYLRHDGVYNCELTMSGTTHNSLTNKLSATASASIVVHGETHYFSVTASTNQLNVGCSLYSF